MARTKIEDKALELLKRFEGAGKTVGRISVEGRKIELVLIGSSETDDFEGLDMRHDKT